MGKKSDQRGLLEVDLLYLTLVGRDSYRRWDLYGWPRLPAVYGRRAHFDRQSTQTTGAVPFPQGNFQFNLAAGTCTCPAGQMKRSVRQRGSYVTGHRRARATGARFTLTRRTVRPVRAAPAVWPRDRGTGGKSVCTRKKLSCRPHARSSRVGFRTLTAPPPSRGAMPGPAGATGSAASPVFRASQDRRPDLSPHYRRQLNPDPRRHLNQHNRPPRAPGFPRI